MAELPAAAPAAAELPVAVPAAARGQRERSRSPRREFNRGVLHGAMLVVKGITAEGMQLSRANEDKQIAASQTNNIEELQHATRRALVTNKTLADITAAAWRVVDGLHP